MADCMCCLADDGFAFLPSDLSIMGVSIHPGQIAFTRIWCGPKSLAISRVRPSTPAFAAAYGAVWPVVANACTEAVLMTAPRPALIITGTTYEQQRKTLRRF